MRQMTIHRRGSAPQQVARSAARPGPRRDPAPSRAAYRMQRLWLTPLFRIGIRAGVPLLVTFAAASLWLSRPGHTEQLIALYDQAVRAVQERPQFMVSGIEIEGASPPVAEAIGEAVPVELPVSSFRLDLAAMQARIEALDAVAAARLHLRGGNMLQIRVTERVPTVVWRGPAGLMLLDDTGHPVAPLEERAARPDLPLIAGEGAETLVAEARAILAAAAPVAERVRGLVRMGQRRWDVVLDRDQRIMLPPEAPVTALEQVMALHHAQDMLDRHLLAVDMRNPHRPTLRLGQSALDDLLLIRAQEFGDSPT